MQYVAEFPDALAFPLEHAANSVDYSFLNISLHHLPIQICRNLQCNALLCIVILVGVNHPLNQFLVHHQWNACRMLMILSTC